jgi:hypothetical protein
VIASRCCKGCRLALLRGARSLCGSHVSRDPSSRARRLEQAAAAAAAAAARAAQAVAAALPQQAQPPAAAVLPQLAAAAAAARPQTRCARPPRRPRRRRRCAPCARAATAAAPLARQQRRRLSRRPSRRPQAAGRTPGLPQARRAAGARQATRVSEAQRHSCRREQAARPGRHAPARISAVWPSVPRRCAHPGLRPRQQQAAARYQPPQGAPRAVPSHLARTYSHPLVHRSGLAGVRLDPPAFARRAVRRCALGGAAQAALSASRTSSPSAARGP